MIFAGPTTLAALLNSLQMGFRTLAIQKRSSEVWNLLAAVKTEFGKFGGVLDGVKKKLQEASNKIDEVDVRSRAITKSCGTVEESPSNPQPLLPELLAPERRRGTGGGGRARLIVIPRRRAVALRGTTTAPRPTSTRL